MPPCQAKQGSAHFQYIRYIRLQVPRRGEYLPAIVIEAATPRNSPAMAAATSKRSRAIQDENQTNGNHHGTCCLQSPPLTYETGQAEWHR